MAKQWLVVERYKTDVTYFIQVLYHSQRRLAWALNFLGEILDGQGIEWKCFGKTMAGMLGGTREMSLALSKIRKDGVLQLIKEERHQKM